VLFDRRELLLTGSQGIDLCLLAGRVQRCLTPSDSINRENKRTQRGVSRHRPSRLLPTVLVRNRIIFIVV